MDLLELQPHICTKRLDILKKHAYYEKNCLQPSGTQLVNYYTLCRLYKYLLFAQKGLVNDSVATQNVCKGDVNLVRSIVNSKC